MADSIFAPQAITEASMAHAYLIEARTDEARERIIRDYARQILCTLGGASAERFDAGACPGFLMPEAEEMTIGPGRELTRALFVRPLESRFKVLVIRNAGELRQEAQNALLKSIEEPPAYAVWLLATNNRAKLLPTIRSRCRVLGFDARPELQSSGIEGLNSMMAWALTGDLLNAFTRRQPFEALKDNRSALLDEMGRYMEQALYFKSTGTWASDCPAAVRASFKAVADRVSVAQCAEAVERIEQMRQLLAVNINATLMLEELILSMGPAPVRDSI